MDKNWLTRRLENISGKDMAGLLSSIAKIDEFKGWWKGAAHLSPQILNRLKRSVIITSAGASTRIEGSELSDKEVEQLLRGLKVTKLKDRDSQEVAGYAELLGMVFDDYRHMKFNEGLILQFHGLLLQFSHKDLAHKGKYKSKPNKVMLFGPSGEQTLLFDPTPPHLAPFETRELVEWTREKLASDAFHPLLVIGNSILEFLAIHPFEDGNGRLSRILTNLLLLQADYAYMPYASLEKIVEDNKTQYYLALRYSQKEIKSPRCDPAPWLRFFVNTLVSQIEALKQLLATKPLQTMLSANQNKVMNLFDRNGEISVQVITEELIIPIPTIKQVLSRLVDLKLIERIGLGRASRYRKV